ncbi:ABC transporter permease [Pseudoduganella ginsengisoli]
MEGIQRLTALLRADVLQRLRAPRVWALLAVLSGAAWFCFPPASSTYMILGVGGIYRGQYGSAWIGMALAMLCIWLSLLGFYAVRGSLARDIDTRVWQLLAATPMPRAVYLLGKWCGNLLVLLIVLAGATVAGLAAQLVRSEDRAIDLIELAKPLLLLALPLLSLTAMCALLFDLLPWLRRTAGNALFLVLWVATLAVTQQGLQSEQQRAGTRWPGDPFGVSVFDRTAHERLARQYAVDAAPGFCLACGMANKQPRMLDWHGWQPTAREAAGRATWLGVALGAVVLMASLLDWAAAQAGPPARGSATGAGYSLRWLDRLLQPLRGTAFGNVLALELQLALRQRRLWWWLSLMAAWAVQLLAKPGVAALALVAAWVLSLDLFARSGLREHGQGMGAVVFGASGAARRVGCARWLMLVLVGVLCGLPLLVRFGIGNAPLALAALAVILSLASWGLALGALTRSAHAFELLVCALAYLAIDGAPALNVAASPALTGAVHVALLPLSALILWRTWPGGRHA